MEARYIFRVFVTNYCPQPQNNNEHIYMQRKMGKKSTAEEERRRWKLAKRGEEAANDSVPWQG